MSFLTLLLFGTELLRVSGVDRAFSNVDRACGPRCVCSVLEYYGRNVDVIRLVEDIQGVELDAGSSMAQLQTSLEEYGIHTQAVDLTESARLVWEHPVLVHLGEESDGHWAVWSPGLVATARPLIHDGVQYLRMTESQFRAVRSGHCILTSNQPIDDVSAAIVDANNTYSYPFLGAVVLFNLTLLGLILKFYHP